MTINKGVQVCMSRKEMGEMALHNSQCFLTVSVIGKVSVFGGIVDCGDHKSYRGLSFMMPGCYIRSQ